MPRKAKKYHFIYKTINLLTGRYYIGMHSTDDLEDGYLGSGKRLRYSIRKYGKQNHQREILEFVDTREKLKARENEIVSLDEIAKEGCMNLQEGGISGFDYIHELRDKNSEFDKKWRQLQSKKMKKLHREGRVKYNTFFGKIHSDESKKKMSESKKGTGIGENNSQFGTCWITNEIENKKIKKEDLNSYINLGWRKGRKMDKNL
jgi:hypothetical protein